MSGALSYLVRTRLKNQIRSLVKNPARLVYAIVILALLVFVFLSGQAGSSGGNGDRRELNAIITAYYLLIFLLGANTGFSTGASVFRMSDVNFLFPGPFSQQRVLFYGLFQQLGTSVLMGFFILFQYAWMHGSYGVTPGEILIILVGYGLVMFSAQLCAMFIYALTAADRRRRAIARGIFVAIPGAYALWLLYTVYMSGAGGVDVLPGLVSAADTLAVRLYPVAGWLGGAVGGALTGDLGRLALGAGIWAVVMIAGVVLLRAAVPDYYEDVLQSTESSYAQKEAAREGRVVETAPRNVKAGKTGLGGGLGASAFYYKHKLENRRSRRFLLSGMSLIFAVCTIVFAFFMGRVGDGGFWGVLGFSIYMQIFTVALGRLVKELTKPYIYLVPEPPFRKLLWCMRESLGGFVVEAVLIFVPVGLILGLNPAEMAACVLMRLGYDYLFLAGNVAAERIFGHISTKALVFIFYFLLLIVMALPGIVLSIVLSVLDVVLVSSVVTTCLAMAVCAFPMALLVVFLCRNMLSNAEMHN